MANPEFLANKNVPAPLVRLLRDQGLGVHAVGEPMSSASDRSVLQHAHVNGQWLLTFARDYAALFAGRAPLAGRAWVEKPPARKFAAYSVALDGKAMAVSESLQATPGVTLTWRS